MEVLDYYLYILHCIYDLNLFCILSLGIYLHLMYTIVKSDIFKMMTAVNIPSGY